MSKEKTVADKPDIAQYKNHKGHIPNLISFSFLCHNKTHNKTQRTLNMKCF